MSDDRELDDGLAAFDQLGRTMAETNRLLSRVQTSQTERTRQENALSAELQAALKQATGASQKALQASKVEFRSNLLWLGSAALLTLLMAFGGGYWFGHQAGSEQGQAAGYQAARNEQAAASWANTPAGQRAYSLDQRGSLDILARCTGRGWKIEAQPGGNACIPYTYDQGQISGWFIP